jgi:hypothetical protein|tara:strand:- start:155 stop:1078 length:924 start_codon:yes stop_codon:yes gene_type:complete
MPRIAKKYKKFSHGGVHTEDEPSDINSNNFSILQALANIYNWKENLAENINPRGYGMALGSAYRKNFLGNEAVQRLYDAIVLDKKELARQLEDEDIEESYDPAYPNFIASQAERQDLLGLMLGQGQKHGSIEPAIYKPTDATDPDAEYVRSKVTEYDIKKFLKNPYVPGRLRGGGNKNQRGYKANKEGDYIGDGKDIAELLIDISPYGKVLGNYKLDKGVDEKGHYISYYDIWDVNPLSDQYEGNVTAIIPRKLDNAIQSAVGIEPREVYGRVYYDPETGKPIDEKKYGGKITLKKRNRMKVVKKYA